MSGVEVVDRGAREIVVFLSGDLNDEASDRLHAAVDEVAQLEQLNALDHVVVNMQHVTQLGEAGVGFLRELTMRGRRTGFEVSFAALSAAAHRAVEDAGWSFVERSPTLHEPEAGG